MCGGYSCSKNTLIGLNIFYVMLGILLIYISKVATGVISLPIIGGILACGIILILISILGLVGAVKHHQVILFFYMIILFVLFVIQFSIACSCLAVNSERQKHLAEEAWTTLPNVTKADLQEKFDCCGLSSNLINSSANEHPSCLKLACCKLDQADNCTKNCQPCLPKLEKTIDDSFRMAGSLGLFFSFTELVAIFITKRYRNQLHPYYLPSHAVFPGENHQY
ncbi:tetraspanin-31 [Culicoides brevitarsis]|uniref:tetraspanin-31 n=1 Tax=Culicoides brevitarsis TaxID=469753 RepID=UPI00307BF130